MKEIAVELVRIAKDLAAGDVFDINNAEEWVAKLKSGINAPYTNIYKSTLGGAKNVSILITVSVDEKKDWKNGILQNSTYFNMHLDNDGSLEVFSGYFKSSKFRKTRVKSVEEAIAKINKFVDLVKSAAVPTTASSKTAAYVSAPVWDVLNETWNVLHDIEYDLGTAASRYDIAASYHGAGAAEAKRVMNRINELKAELEKISHHSFEEVTRMEQDFVKKFGTPDEFADKSRREIFPN